MGTPFKMKGSPMARNFGISPVKQNIDHVGKTVDKIHSNEKSISTAKESIKKSVKKVKSNTVTFKNSDIVKQLKKAGSKLKLPEVQKSITKNILPKVAKFVPAINLAMNLFSTSSKADQPKFKKGDTHYRDPKKQIDFSKKQ